ncbi:MAG: hypothetical protein E6K90_10065 [Thaumarchaeota archaeon]|nr:MAG: hypothetical protein E6K90_10065 [Nitrososphaerota archaeon]
MTVLLAGLGGGLVGVGASYYVFYSKPKPTKALTRDEGGRLKTATFSLAELERSRREMRTIVLERDLLSSALMKLYEAETEGRITKEEREMITKRYTTQIKSFESKLKDVELVVEVGELERLRDDLMSLFREKVQNIEARLEQAKERLAPPAPELERAREAQVRRVERVDDLEKVIERKTARPEVSEAERRVKAIRDEVMEALTKLEQIDLEKQQEKA